MLPVHREENAMNEPVHSVFRQAVRRDYLLRLVARCVVLAAVTAGVFILVMMVALSIEVSGSYRQVAGAVDSAMSRMTVVASPLALICAALMGAGCAFVAVRATHEIAGPAYRCAADLRRMATGDYDFVVATRRKDQLKDVADELELARGMTAGRLLRLRQSVRRLSELAGNGRCSADELERAVTAVKQTIVRDSQPEAPRS